MSRRTAREKLVQLIYERAVTGETNPFTYEELTRGEDEAQQSYLSGGYQCVDENYDFLISVIDRYTEDFSIERVYKVDLALMLVSAAEFLFLDIPVAASVNEAVELCKLYSTEKSTSYINGVLASVARDKAVLLEEFEARKAAAQE